MAKGIILVICDNPFEKQILQNFFEAADYRLVDWDIEPTASQPPIEITVDAAVISTDREYSQIHKLCDQIRVVTSKPDLPIIAVMSDQPQEPQGSVQILLRPIRLFDLVDELDEIVGNEELKRVGNSREPHRASAGKSSR